MARISRRVAANTTALMVAQAIAIGFGVLAVGVSTRYLGPESYGRLVTALAYASVVTVIADAGLFTIGTRELAREGADSRGLASNLLGVGLALSGVMAVAGLALLPLVYGGADDGEIRIAVLIMLLGGPLTAVLGVGTALAVAAHRPYVAAIGTAVGSLVALLIVTLAASLHLGFAVVAIATVGGTAAGLLVVLTVMGRSVPAPAGDLRRWKALLRESTPVGAVNAINLVYIKADVILLSLLSTSTAVGIYGLSYRLVDALIVLPGLFMLTLQPEMMRAVNHPERLRRLIQGAFSISQMVALPLVVFFITFRNDVAILLGGSTFAGAGSVLGILSLGVAISYPSGILGAGLVATGRQSLLLFSTSITLGFNLVANIAVIPPYGVNGAAAVFALSEALSFTIVALSYRSVMPLPRLDRPAKNLAALGLMACVCLARDLTTGLSPLAVLATFGVASVLVYGAGLWIAGLLGPDRDGTLLAK